MTAVSNINESSNITINSQPVKLYNSTLGVDSETRTLSAGTYKMIDEAGTYILVHLDDIRIKEI